jgi:hypothetical protein
MSKTHTLTPTRRSAKSKPTTASAKSKSVVKKNTDLTEAISVVWKAASKIYRKENPHNENPPPSGMFLRSLGLDSGMSGEEMEALLPDPQHK